MRTASVQCDTSTDRLLSTSIKPPEVRLQIYFLVWHIVLNTSTQYNVDDPTRTQEQGHNLAHFWELPAACSVTATDDICHTNAGAGL